MKQQELFETGQREPEPTPKKKRGPEQWSEAEAAFEKARKAYPKKTNMRGHDKEWSDFRRYVRDYKTAAFELYPAIKIIERWKEHEERKDGWTPPWKDFIRFYRHRVWEQAEELGKLLKEKGLL